MEQERPTPIAVDYASGEELPWRQHRVLGVFLRMISVATVAAFGDVRRRPWIAMIPDRELRVYAAISAALILAVMSTSSLMWGGTGLLAEERFWTSSHPSPDVLSLPVALSIVACLVFTAGSLPIVIIRIFRPCGNELVRGILCAHTIPGFAACILWLTENIITLPVPAAAAFIMPFRGGLAVFAITTAAMALLFWALAVVRAIKGQRLTQAFVGLLLIGLVGLWITWCYAVPKSLKVLTREGAIIVDSRPDYLWRPLAR